jgi:hypothetical protein
MTKLLQENALSTQWTMDREWFNKFVISTGGVMGLRPTQGDEKRLLLKAALHESAALPFVISTEAKRSGEISVLMSLRGNVFRQSVA